jgi:hypothetical protein
MTILTYNQGQRVRLTAHFTNDEGADADPNVIRLKVKDPTGTVTEYVYPAAPVVKDDTGNYHADIVPNLAGDWYYRWESEGVPQVAEDSQFMVSDSPVLAT